MDCSSGLVATTKGSNLPWSAFANSHKEMDYITAIPAVSGELTVTKEVTYWPPVGKAAHALPVDYTIASSRGAGESTKSN